MWINAIVIGCGVAAIMLTGHVLSCRQLVQRLQAFSYSIMVLIPGLLAVAIAYAIEVRVRDPRLVLARGEQLDSAWFTSVSQAQTSTSMLLVGAMFIFALMAVQLLAVLTLARRFVVTQEIDLVARDQVAMHQATKPGDTAGIPVSVVPEPN